MQSPAAADAVAAAVAALQRNRRLTPFLFLSHVTCCESRYFSLLLLLFPIKSLSLSLSRPTAAAAMVERPASLQRSPDRLISRHSPATSDGNWLTCHEPEPEPEPALSPSEPQAGAHEYKENLPVLGRKRLLLP